MLSDPAQQQAFSQVGMSQPVILVPLHKPDALQTSLHRALGEHRPARRDMALSGVFPQCCRYKIQEFSLSSHFTLS